MIQPKKDKSTTKKVGPTLTNENLSPIKIKPSTKGSKTSKNEMKGKEKGFKTPEKGDFFTVKGIVGEVLDVNKPTAGVITVSMAGGPQEIILAGSLWKQIDQKKGYYKNLKHKHDWDAIKREFLASNYYQVGPFLKYKHGIDTAQNGNAKDRTEGWAEEKKRIKAEMEAKAMEDFKANLGDQWKQAFAKIERAHLKGLESLTDMILHQGEVDRVENIIRYRDRDTGEIREIKENEDTVLRPYLNHGDIVNILKHLKIEKGEPTEIFETGNTSKTRKWMEEMRKGKESIL